MVSGDFHEKRLPGGYARSLAEKMYRDECPLIGRAGRNKIAASAIENFVPAGSVRLNQKREAIPNLPYAGYARALGIWPLN